MTNQSLSNWDQESVLWAKRMVNGQFNGIRGAFDNSQGSNPSFLGYWQLLEQDQLNFVGFAICPGFRGNGYGRSCFKLLNEFLSVNYSSTLYLEVLESNRNALSIYKSCGYKTVALKQKVVYGESRNVYVMKLE